MSSVTITLPVPINVEFKKQGSRSVSTKKTYNEGEFGVPSFSLDQVALVAQWCQPWDSAQYATSSEANLLGGDFADELAQGAHLVALISVNGLFYAPVRGRQTDGAFQHLITTQNVLSVLSQGLQTVGPFGSFELYPPYMGFNIRNHGVTRDRPFAETGVPDGQVLVGTNEADRVEQITNYLEKNLIVVDGVLFSRIGEPMIVVKPGAEAVSLFMATKHEDDSLTPIFSHYFRLDELDRALQMIEDRWSKGVIKAKFTNLSVLDPVALSGEFEVGEALRLSRRFFSRLGPVLQQMDWDTAEPWYALKELLRNPNPSAEDVDEMISLVEKSVNALERNADVDAEWRDRTVLYGRLGAERWMYRPVTMVGPRI